jgi:hypothetical protein
VDRRPDARFGLRDNSVYSVAGGIDLTPGDALTLGVVYGYERYSSLQRSRQANPGPQFDDPTRDWSTDLDEDVHTITGTLEVPRLMANTSLRVGYDLVSSRARYRYDVVPGSTLATPQQLQPVTNDLQRGSADVRYAFTPRVALGLGYAFDRYDVDDFALSPGTLDSPVFPTLLSLMYQWRDYRVHAAFIRLHYRF